MPAFREALTSSTSQHRWHSSVAHSPHPFVHRVAEDTHRLYFVRGRVWERTQILQRLDSKTHQKNGTASATMAQNRDTTSPQSGTKSKMRLQILELHKKSTALGFFKRQSKQNNLNCCLSWLFYFPFFFERKSTRVTLGIWCFNS